LKSCLLICHSEQPRALLLASRRIRPVLNSRIMSRKEACFSSSLILMIISLIAAVTSFSCHSERAVESTPVAESSPARKPYNAVFYIASFHESSHYHLLFTET
jgi:hypothetical protein